MNKKSFLKETNNYSNQLELIINRFIKGKNWHIHDDDKANYKKLVFELIDFFTDNLDKTLHADQIRLFYNEGLDNFYKTPTYSSIENIKSVVDSVITRVNRNPNALKKATKGKPVKNNDLNSTEKITLPWLKRNVSASMWWKFVLLLIFVFCMGANSTALKSIRDFLNIFPWYNISYEIPIESQKVIKSQIESLTNAHNKRLEELQKNLLVEEKLSGDHTIIYSTDRALHTQSAERIKTLIKNENDNFIKEVKLIREFIDQPN